MKASIADILKPTANDLAVIKKLNLKDPWIWLATWGCIGLMRPAPGTWGSLAALPVGILIHVIGGPIALIAAIIVVTYYGWKSAKRFEDQTGTHDSSMIVVDEVAGQWIALLGTALNPALIVLSFLLFRFFDITKIWPANWCDQKLPGAYGVMADDLVAGLYAFLLLLGIHYAGLA